MSKSVITTGPLADMNALEEPGESITHKLGVPFRKFGKLSKAVVIVSKDSTVAKVNHVRNVHEGKKVVKANLAQVGAQNRQLKKES